MKPLEPQDPLWTLLGKARRTKARDHFAPDLARLARRTPQQQGWWPRLCQWWQERVAMGMGTELHGGLALTVVAALVVVGSIVTVQTPSHPLEAGFAARISSAHSLAQDQARAKTSAALGNTPSPAAVESEAPLASLDYLDALLAAEDTSALSDREIAFLLY